MLPFRLEKRTILVLGLVLCNALSVYAKKEKGTSEPTLFPSSFPSSMPSDNPSEFPTQTPTRQPSTPFPTKRPTINPTKSPTTSPTNRPTMIPTKQPTNKPTITATSKPTATATKRRTSSPTMKKTNSPTESGPESDGLGQQTGSVVLPTIAIDLIMSDEDAASDKVDNLDLDLSIFFHEVLATNSGVDSFDHASLNFDVRLASFGRRKLETGLSISIDGTAYFGGHAPSQEYLTQSLLAYFSFWGVQDLENYLTVTGLTSAEVAEILINGTPVQEVEKGETTGAEVTENEASTQSPFLNPLVIAGIAAVLLICVLAVLVFLLQSRKPSGGDPNSPRDSGRPGRTKASTAPSNSTNSNSRGMDEENSQYSDAISIDNSLYTTDTSRVSVSYDAKRLDKVIAAAKQHTTAGEQ